MLLKRHKCNGWLHGGLNVLNGHEVVLTLPEQTSEMTVCFLEHLQTCNPNRAHLVLLDRARWHKGQPVADFLAAHPCVQTLHFPPAYPQLNPQEPLWERTRDLVNLNHTHQFPAFGAGLSFSFRKHPFPLRLDQALRSTQIVRRLIALSIRSINMASTAK